MTADEAREANRANQARWRERNPLQARANQIAQNRTPEGRARAPDGPPMPRIEAGRLGGLKTAKRWAP